MNTTKSQINIANSTNWVFFLFFVFESMRWLPMAGHFQWNWWVWKWAIHNSIKNPFVSCLCIVYPIPIDHHWRVFTCFPHQNFFAMHCYLPSTPNVLVVVVLSSMPTTCLQWVHKPCNFQTIIINKRTMPYIFSILFTTWYWFQPLWAVSLHF